MDVVLLSRIQFAVTIGFHYIFPPLSIGLSLMLVYMEGMFLKTKDPAYRKMTKFWVGIFALIFTFGVATGIVMSLQFGTNWAAYSRFVGDVFGSPLASEAIFAFFLESAFLAILVFGWNKVSPKVHFISTIMVSIGTHLSAFLIIVANSWQQTPAGYNLVQTESVGLRAEIIDFWAMVFNPSSVDRFAHAVIAAWVTGACLVAGVAAYHLLKKREVEISKKTLKVAVIMLFVTALLQLGSGHSSANIVADHQPAKLAAIEGHFETAPGDMYLFGWVDEANSKTYGLALPNFLSFLVDWNFETEIKGLNDFAPEDRPPVNIVFQTYHIMVVIGMLFILMGLIGVILLVEKRLFVSKWYLWALLPMVWLAEFANQFGWMTAEIGRQPWVVYNMLRTSDAASLHVSGSEVIFSLVLFSVVYVFLGAIFLMLMKKKIQAFGNDAEVEPESY